MENRLAAEAPVTTTVRWTQLHPDDRWSGGDWLAWWSTLALAERESLLELGHGEDPPIDARLRALPGVVEVDDRPLPPRDPFKTRVSIPRWRLTQDFHVWLDEMRTLWRM